MSSEWPLVTLKDVTSILGDGLHGTPVYDANGEYLFINGNNLTSGKIEVNTTTKRVSYSEYLKYKKNLTERTILVSINGTLGNIAFYAGEKVVLGKSACYLNVLDEVDKHFVRYVLESNIFQDYIQNLATGSTIKNVSLKLMREFEFALPPIDSQRRISGVLRTLDDSITLLRETNATLEAIAQALFKSWFIDFDPVRAKMEGRAPEGMDEATAALFPDSFEETELAVVPKGWGAARLDSFLELAYGKALKAETRKPGGVPVYGSGGITGWHDTALVAEPSVIVGRKGTVGSIYWESRPFFPIDTVFYVKTKHPLTYCHQLLKTLGLREMNTDAAVPGLNRENVYRLRVPDAPSAVLAAFDKIAHVLRQRINHNEAQAHTLTASRDTLLPRLITGIVSIT